MASLVADGVKLGDVDTFIDTGSHIFNALLSKYTWYHQTRLLLLVKVLLVKLSFVLVKHFLDSNSDAGVIYFESESALTKSMIEEKGIDSERMIIRNHCTRI